MSHLDRAKKLARAGSKPLRRWWRRTGRHVLRLPVRLGDLERTTPFSNEFGFDRGGAIDRIYIDRFLDANRASIRGRVLEIGDDAYTRAFGGSRVTRADVLHVDPAQTQATWIGDLSDLPQVPDGTYDCLVITQTLHLIYDVRAALRTCHRILAPGGVLLLTSPGISQVDAGDWGATWYWSFTDRAVKKLLADTFPDSAIEVTTYGNVYAATTFLYGLGAPEIKRRLLEPADERYPVIVAAVARKRA